MGRPAPRSVRPKLRNYYAIYILETWFEHNNLLLDLR